VTQRIRAATIGINIQCRQDDNWHKTIGSLHLVAVRKYCDLGVAHCVSCGRIDRNITSHAYNESLAESVREKIPNYFELMKNVSDRIKLN
jgi:hypothetical protein